MSAHKDQYKAEAERLKRQFEGPKRTKRFCWRLETYVEFIDARCSQDGCPHRHSEGCIEDVRLVG